MSSERAREMISSIIEAIGIERFLSEMNVSREDVDAWLKGERPIPFHILSKALKMKAELYYRKPRIARVEVYARSRSVGSTAVFKKMLIKSTIIVLAMLTSSMIGYTVGSWYSSFYAGLGLFLPLTIGLVLILILGLKS
ncbi:MAG: hypothetical protein QXH79_06210 [Candidatus Bathyarchaeia archaeon]